VVKQWFSEGNLRLNSKILLAVSLLIIAFPIIAYAISGTIAVDIEGTSVDISYETEGVEIIGIEFDLDEIELIVKVQVTGSPGILELTFDRQIFDATFDGNDDSFLVIADGKFIEVEETETTSESRTLRLELRTGTDEIEIFGTKLSSASLDQPEIIEEPEVIEEISVETELALYSPGSTVVISGFIQTLNDNPNQPVLIRIFDPENHIVTIQQVNVNSDRTYFVEVIAGGPWKTAGEYLVSVNYGGKIAEVTFEFTGGEGYTPPPPPPDTTPPLPPPDTTPSPPEPIPEPVTKIPEWVRNIFIWYAEERISEDELLGAIQFLLDQGILKSKS